MGGVSAGLVLSAFFFRLWQGGWAPGTAITAGSALHRTATTTTFLGIVACQVGTAFAARTERVSLLRVGLYSNRLLLWGILCELALAALIVWAPPLRAVFLTAPPPLESLIFLAPSPLVVWGADEIYRWRMRAAGAQRRTGAR